MRLVPSVNDQTTRFGIVLAKYAQGLEVGIA